MFPTNHVIYFAVHYKQRVHTDGSTTEIKKGSFVTKMPPKIEKLFDGLQIGEGPHWDVESQSLYFVDSSKGTICRYVPATKQLSEAALVGM